MTNELKPCPFCGSEAKLFTARGKCNQIVRCVACNVSPGYRQTKKEAIEAWNTRAHKPFVLTNGVAFCCECGTCIGRHDDHYSECPNCGAKVIDKVVEE